MSTEQEAREKETPRERAWRFICEWVPKHLDMGASHITKRYYSRDEMTKVAAAYASHCVEQAKREDAAFIQKLADHENELDRKLEKAESDLAESRRTQEYWKAEHLAANEKIATLEAMIPHPGDGSCDHCGKVPSIAIPTSLCDECRDGLKRAEKAEQIEELVEAAEALFNACALADSKEELSDLIDGKILDAVRVAVGQWRGK